MAKSLINWNASLEDKKLVTKIAVRAIEMYESIGVKTTKDTNLEIYMDVLACHCNGTPLDLERLLEAPEQTFVHDIVGIRDCINRRTGKIEKHFLPKCHNLKE